MPSPPSATVSLAPSAERLVRIIDGLCSAVAARGAGGLLTAPLLFLLWSRLRRIVTLATRIAAGAPQEAARQRAARPRPSRPPILRLPRGHAWLVRLVPGTAAYGSQLQTLLADPLMAPLAEEPRLRRMINPLCRMLGVTPPQPRQSPVSTINATTADGRTDSLSSLLQGGEGGVRRVCPQVEPPERPSSPNPLLPKPGGEGSKMLAA